MMAGECNSTKMVMAEISDEELAEVAMILGMRRSFDMSVYKDSYMKRRVAIRLRSARCGSVAEYCCLLRESQQELDLLQKALTIHVSHFFRNPSMFDMLRQQVLPGLFDAASKANAETVRLCCLGCAGGEEPYSLAILLREYFGRQIRQIPVRIIASDIDVATLVTAERGEYGEDRLKEVPQELRERYFRFQEGRFRLIPAIREMVAFSRENISCTDRYPASDLMLCRNTLIYFNRLEQEKILNGLAGTLAPGSILVLGKSETLVGDARQHFVSISLAERIYRRV